MRAFVAGFVFAVVLAAAYLSLNPPRTEPFADRETGRPSGTATSGWCPCCWSTRCSLVFLVAQATVVFGGHDYLESTTGLTYADYVHQGFGQLTVATALTLLVVWAAARKAPRETPSDRAWLRGALGLLCVLTLVVVASALYRMHVYQEAYGFTRLRLLVDVFEGWLGLLVLGVMAAGCRACAAGWLPRAAVLTGAAALLGLAAINPDAWIARSNLEREDVDRRRRWTSTTCSTRSPPTPCPSWSTRLPDGVSCSAAPRRRRRLAGVEPRSRPGGVRARGRRRSSPAPPSQSR